MPLGVALAAIGIAGAGIAPSFGLTALAVGIGGLGVAAFHPEAARYAGYVSGSSRGKGMSYFAVGGNLGFALGPALVTPVIATFGISATPLIAIPGLVVSALLLSQLGHLRSFAPPTPVTRAPDDAGAPEAWWPFTRLVSAAVCRTAAFFALQAFVPVYLIHHYGTSTATAGAALAAMLLAGALGTLVGGRCADRYGRRIVLVGSMVPLIPLLVLLPHVGLVAFFAVLIGVGLAVDSPFATTVVLGQEYLPHRVALSSGITYGLAIGVGGLAATGLGALADATSIKTVFEVLPVFAVLALVLAATLPPAPARR
jgi:FSR family fosmidomycin resistance protein-like MFS transporter